MGTFDLTFDQTFQSMVISPSLPSVSGCRKPGVFLYWLTGNGWCWHLFEAYKDNSESVSAIGSFRRTGLTLHTQKEAAEELILRTSKLSQQKAFEVKSVYKSVSVWVIAPDESGVQHRVRVTLETGNFPYGSSKDRRTSLSVKIIFPSVSSQRI